MLLQRRRLNENVTNSTLLSALWCTSLVSVAAMGCVDRCHLLLHRGCSRCNSRMQTSLVLLEQEYRRRYLHQPGPILPLERRGKFVDRLHDTHSHFTSNLASESSGSSKGFAQCDLSPRYLVSRSAPSSLNRNWASN